MGWICVLLPLLNLKAVFFPVCIQLFWPLNSSKPFYLPPRPFSSVAKKPHIPTGLFIPSAPPRFPQTSEHTDRTCRNPLQLLHGCRHHPAAAAAAAGMRAGRKSFPRCLLRDLRLTTVVCGAERVLCQRVAGSDTSLFGEAQPCRVSSQIFTLHELIKWLLHIRRDFFKKKNSFLSVLCWLGGFILASPLCFLFFSCCCFSLFTSFWCFVTKFMHETPFWIPVSHHSKRSSNPAPHLQWVVRDEGWTRPLQGH